MTAYSFATTLTHRPTFNLKSFCAPLAYDILHWFGLWRARDGRKAISQIILHGKIGLRLK